MKFEVSCKDVAATAEDRQCMASRMQDESRSKGHRKGHVTVYSATILV